MNFLEYKASHTLYTIFLRKNGTLNKDADFDKQVASDGTICTNYADMKYADYYLLDSFNLKTNQIGKKDAKKVQLFVSTAKGF